MVVVSVVHEYIAGARVSVIVSSAADVLVMNVVRG